MNFAKSVCRLVVVLAAFVSACGGGGGSGEVDAAGGGGAGGGGSDQAAATLTMSPLAVESYGLLAGKVSDARSNTDYGVRFDLGAGKFVDQHVMLAADGTLTVAAPPGQYDSTLLFKSGPVNVSLLEFTSPTVPRVLNRIVLQVNVPDMPPGNVLGRYTTQYAKLQAQLIANAQEGADRLTALGINTLAPLGRPDANAAFYQRLIAATEAVATTGKSAQIATAASGVYLTLTPELLAMLDKQYFVFLKSLPAAPKKALSDVPRRVHAAAARVADVNDDTDLIDFKAWANGLTAQIRDTIPKVGMAAGAVIAIAGFATGAAEAGLVIGAVAFMATTYAPAMITATIDGAVATMDGGRATYDTFKPTIDFVGKQALDYYVGGVVDKAAERLCGQPCSLGTTVADVGGKISDALVQTGEKISQKFSDLTLPVAGIKPSSFTITNLGLIQDPPTSGLPTPSWLVSVYTSPDPLATAQRFTVSILNADGALLWQDKTTIARSYSVKATLTPRGMACTPTLTFLAENDAGTARYRTTISGTPFCDQGSGAGVSTEEFVEWAIDGVTVARVKPYSSNVSCDFNVCAAGAKNISFSLQGVRNADLLELGIDLSNLSLGSNATFRDNNCLNLSGVLSTGFLGVFNPAFVQFYNAPINYGLYTCTWNTKHGAASAGTLTLSVLNVASTQGSVVANQFVKGTFSFRVADGTPEAANFFLSERTVTGSFQFIGGQCVRSSVTGQVICHIEQ